MFNRLDLALWWVELAHIEAMLPWFQNLKVNCKKKTNNQTWVGFWCKIQKFWLVLHSITIFYQLNQKPLGTMLGGLLTYITDEAEVGVPQKNGAESTWVTWVSGISPSSAENKYIFILGPFSSQLRVCHLIPECTFQGSDFQRRSETLLRIEILQNVSFAFPKLCEYSWLKVQGKNHLVKYHALYSLQVKTPWDDCLEV